MRLFTTVLLLFAAVLALGATPSEKVFDHNREQFEAELVALWSCKSNEVKLDVGPDKTTVECPAPGQFDATFRQLLRRRFGEELSAADVAGLAALATKGRAVLDEKQAPKKLPMLPPETTTVCIRDGVLVALEKCYRTYHVLTVSNGGTVSLISNLTKEEADKIKARLSTPCCTVGPGHNTCECDVSPGDFKSVEVFQ